MILKISRKSVVRTPKKSALFLFLIFVLTLMLYLGVSTLNTVSGSLDKCNKMFTTVAQFEYMGADYPDEAIMDEQMQTDVANFDYSAVTDSKYVTDWQPTVRRGGGIDGYQATLNNQPYKRYAVLVVKNISLNKANNLYSGYVINSLYSSENFGKKQMLVFLYPEDKSTVFDSDCTYVVTGQFIIGANGYRSFLISNFKSAAAEAAGVDLSEVKACTKINNYDEFMADSDNIYHQISDYYQKMNNGVVINSVHDINITEGFHQKDLYITSGREFTQDEINTSAKVCIIPDRIALNLKLSVGSHVSITKYNSSENLPVMDCYWPTDSEPVKEDYLVIGTASDTSRTFNHIFVPEKDTGFTPKQYGYSIGQAKLINGTSDDFLSYISPMLPDRMVVRVYDQNYQSVANSLNTMQLIAIILTTVSAVAAITVLILFAYLFVSKQKDTALTMLYLGTKRSSVYRYLISGAGLISLVGAALGCIAGYFSSNAVFDAVYSLSVDFNAADARFSNSKIGIDIPFTPTSIFSPLVLIFTGTAVVVLALVLCLIFALGIGRMQSKKSEKTSKKKKLKREKKSSMMHGGALKYSLLSIRRGGTRSIVVPLVSLAMAVFLITISQTELMYTRMLDNVYDTTEITGQFTDSTFKMVNNLAIRSMDVKTLVDSKMVDNVNLTIQSHYMFSGITTYADETVNPNYEDIEIPESSFALETFQIKMMNSAELVFTNNLRTSPEFYYSKTVLTDFLDGWDESVLSKTDDTNCPPCVISQRLLKSENIKYGDIIKILYLEDEDYFFWLEMKVVGSFASVSAKDNIYCPLSQYALDCVYKDDTDSDRYRNSYCSFTSVTFSTKDANQLAELKDYLYDKEFCGPDSTTSLRMFIMLNDKEFLKTVKELRQQIDYIDMFIPIFFVIAVLIGIAVSYLMVNSRKNEFAIIQGLGSSPGLTFLSFFLEQMILCIAGMVLGTAACLFFVAPSDFRLILLPIFTASYLFGSAIAVIILNNTNTLKNLNDNE